MSRELSFGKYRGRVESNKDPKGLGRLQVNCPAVHGCGKHNWALPCVPYAGKQVGWFVIPPVGAQVWIEFEAGDPDYPIWSGCFWLDGEVPISTKPASPDIKMLKTDHVRLEINESADQDKAGVFLEIDNKVLKEKLQLTMNSQGIELNHGDKRIVRITEETIEIIHSDQAKIILTNEDIELSSDPVSIKLVKGDPSVHLAAGNTTSTHWAGSELKIKQGEAELQLSSAGLEAKQGAGTAKISSQGVQLACSTSLAKVEAAGVEISDGTGGMIKISGPSVNLNNGALEVI